MATIEIINSPHEAQDPNHGLNIFLAGPILGTGDWQNEAGEILTRLAGMDLDPARHINVFNPRRPEFTDLKDFSDDTFYEQVDWEHEHLARTKALGIMVFWLANKTIEMPHRNFGLTTLFELGEAIATHAISGTNPIVVGIEPGFTNEKYLRYTIEKKAPNVTLTSDLEATCMAAYQHIMAF